MNPLNIIEIGKTNPRLAKLIAGVIPEPKKLECVYCHKNFVEGTPDFDYVRTYGFCVMCDDLHQDYMYDARIEYLATHGDEEVEE